MHARKRKMKLRQKQKQKKKRKVAMHAVGFSGAEPFQALKGIYSNGFKGGIAPNVIVGKGASAMRDAYLHAPPSYDSVTSGDRYVIELKTKVRIVKHRGHFVEESPPNQLKCIYIFFSMAMPEEKIALRKKFYQKQFPKVELVFLHLGKKV